LPPGALLAEPPAPPAPESPPAPSVEVPPSAEPLGAPAPPAPPVAVPPSAVPLVAAPPIPPGAYSSKLNAIDSIETPGFQIEERSDNEFNSCLVVHVPMFTWDWICRSSTPFLLYQLC
jgi:hypothetical protein